VSKPSVSSRACCTLPWVTPEPRHAHCGAQFPGLGINSIGPR
jgi:hypothetical protein